MNTAFSSATYTARFQYTIARDISTFTVTRAGANTIDVDIGATSVAFSGQDTPEATVEFEATTTYLLPGL